MVEESPFADVLLGLAVMSFGPFAVVQALLWAEHISPWRSQFAEFVFLTAGVAVGAVGIWVLPVRRWVRQLLMVPYIPLISAAVWVSALPAVCSYFGECL